MEKLKGLRDVIGNPIEATYLELLESCCGFEDEALLNLLDICTRTLQNAATESQSSEIHQSLVKIQKLVAKKIYEAECDTYEIKVPVTEDECEPSVCCRFCEENVEQSKLAEHQKQNCKGLTLEELSTPKKVCSKYLYCISAGDIECTLCKLSFKSFEKKIVHEDTFGHLSRASEISPRVLDTIFCSHCCEGLPNNDVQFFNHFSCKSHRRLVEPIVTWYKRLVRYHYFAHYVRCITCEENLSGYNDVVEHHSIKHYKTKRQKLVCRVWCKLCDRFDDLHNLNVHFLNCSKLSVFYCQLCNKAVWGISSFLLHVKSCQAVLTLNEIILNNSDVLLCSKDIAVQLVSDNNSAVIAASEPFINEESDANLNLDHLTNLPLPLSEQTLQKDPAYDFPETNCQTNSPLTTFNIKNSDKFLIESNSVEHDSDTSSSCSFYSTDSTAFENKDDCYLSQPSLSTVDPFSDTCYWCNCCGDFVEDFTLHYQKSCRSVGNNILSVPKSPNVQCLVSIVTNGIRCNYCKKYVRYLELFKKHAQNEHTGKNLDNYSLAFLQCLVCFDYIPNDIDCYKHHIASSNHWRLNRKKGWLKQHTYILLFFVIRCHVCKLNLLSIKHLKKHHKEHHGSVCDATAWCSSCDTSVYFGDIKKHNELISHQEWHLREMTCLLCKASLIGFFNFIRHVQDCRESNDSSNSPQNVPQFQEVESSYKQKPSQPSVDGAFNTNYVISNSKNDFAQTLRENLPSLSGVLFKRKSKYEAPKDQATIAMTSSLKSNVPSKPSSTAVPTAQGSGAQLDYSAQWAGYNCSVGKIKEAEAYEAQMKSKPAVVAEAGKLGVPEAAAPDMVVQPLQGGGQYRLKRKSNKKSSQDQGTIAMTPLKSKSNVPSKPSVPAAQGGGQIKLKPISSSSRRRVAVSSSSTNYNTTLSSSNSTVPSNSASSSFWHSVAVNSSSINDVTTWSSSQRSQPSYLAPASSSGSVGFNSANDITVNWPNLNNPTSSSSKNSSPTSTANGTTSQTNQNDQQSQTHLNQPPFPNPWTSLQPVPPPPEKCVIS